MTRQTSSEILSRHGIALRTWRHGNQKTRCPRCSDTRRNKREACLSVEIGTDGVRFLCHHCGWHGGEFYDQRDAAPEPMRRKRTEGRGSERAVRGMYR